MDYDRRTASVNDPWVSREQVAQICPSCADRMKQAGIRAIKASRLLKAAWENLPKGWTEESVKKMWESLTGNSPKHKVTACMRKMKGKVSDEGAFCASLADKILGRTDWRGEDSE